MSIKSPAWRSWSTRTGVELVPFWQGDQAGHFAGSGTAGFPGCLDAWQPWENPSLQTKIFFPVRSRVSGSLLFCLALCLPGQFPTLSPYLLLQHLPHHRPPHSMGGRLFCELPKHPAPREPPCIPKTPEPWKLQGPKKQSRSLRGMPPRLSALRPQGLEFPQ